ncbi:MAG: carboxypeptidase-like regulatory domain-containing protein, partial [Bacteroidetes bacterium]|nr:carboxypeptidase-like regulatory domain-containing protein [Bacteroidota bacterium]
MKRTLQVFFGLWLLLGMSEGMAQQREVSGTVTSQKDGSSLPGVSVAVKGTTQGTLTNQNGAYSIRVNDPGTVLVFSSIGFLPQEATVGNRSTINISLAEDTKTLNEVVVT